MHELLKVNTNFNFLINDNPKNIFYNAAIFKSESVETDDEFVVVVSRISVFDELIQLEFDINTVDNYLAEGYWIVIDERDDDLDKRIKSFNSRY
jgi:hypothetical protein